ncbi:MAG TPA: VOC family protein [Candidatus Limnocylindria bacterium]|jgi:catechol 2,3-dioxygenase-like lactoylglutathione lyase family enzyme|nr:VOC family protein [Candidatus Limnocylindria bacterium]
MKPFTLGPVGHFGLAVRDPRRSAEWFQRCLLLDPYMEAGDAVSVGNDAVTIWFYPGTPSPETIDHLSFQLRDRAELERALAHLKHEHAKLEDPGDEIGPQAPGAPDIGIWFHDLDGYRWELSTPASR